MSNDPNIDFDKYLAWLEGQTWVWQEDSVSSLFC